LNGIQLENRAGSNPAAPTRRTLLAPTIAIAMATFPGDCLPPEAIYDSRTALFEAINSWAITRGYAFTTERSTAEKSGRVTITFACDRSRRPPKALSNRQRKTTSRVTSCLFSVLAKESSDGSWVLKHRSNPRFSVYDHEPSQHPVAYPIHRQLSGGTSQLTTFSNAGLAPKEIQTLIRQSGSLATRQDIYNRITDIRRDACEG
jgi:hypothetical protein